MQRKINEAYFARCFRIMYLLMVMFNFTNVTTETKFFSVVMAVTVVFGIALLCIRLLRVKDFFQTPGLLILVAFLVLYGISSVINFRYGGVAGLISNIKSEMWMCFHLLLLYAFVPTNKEELLKEIRLLLGVVVVFNFISVFGSYLMLLLNFSYKRQLADQVVLYGVMWNRLWGTFTDPNYGAVLSAVAILSSCYFIQKSKKILLRVFNISNILLSLLYIVYSDSRTGTVALGVGIAVYSFASLLWSNKKRQCKIVANVVTCAIISLGIVALVLGSFNTVKTLGIMPRTVYLRMQGKVESMPIEIGRNLTNYEGDISNRRFDIWKSGLEIFQKTPFFGTSFRNMVPFAANELPETYIVNNDSGWFYCMHNSLMDILVSQGFLGLVVFVLFAIVVIKKVLCVLLKKNRKVSCELIALVSCILVETAAAMFLSEIMYINSIGGAIFWIFLGYCMQICCMEEKENA